jgi:DNA-directed RNA polymerase subunit RPC12/RpoP
VYYAKGRGSLNGLRKWVQIIYICLDCHKRRVVESCHWENQYDDEKPQIIFKCNGCGAEDKIHKSWFHWHNMAPIFVEEEF